MFLSFSGFEEKRGSLNRSCLWCWIILHPFVITYQHLKWPTPPPPFYSTFFVMCLAQIQTSRELVWIPFQQKVLWIKTTHEFLPSAAIYLSKSTKKWKIHCSIWCNFILQLLNVLWSITAIVKVDKNVLGSNLIHDNLFLLFSDRSFERQVEKRWRWQFVWVTFEQVF